MGQSTQTAALGNVLIGLWFFTSFWKYQWDPLTRARGLRRPNDAAKPRAGVAPNRVSGLRRNGIALNFIKHTSALREDEFVEIEAGRFVRALELELAVHVRAALGLT